jgi:hypothetical protein
MDQKMNMEELLLRPAFSVENGRITRINREAGKYFLEEGMPIAPLIAAGQEAQADRMRALEAAINSSIRVTPAQIKYLNTAIRERANVLLVRLTVEDAKARRKLSNMIRKDTLVFFGVSSISEIPASEYSHARNLIMSWKNVIAVRDIAKEVQCDADAE